MSYTNKTQPTKQSPENFLIEHFKDNNEVRADAHSLISLFEKVTGSPCIMWNKIFGFGKYWYQDSKGGEHSFLKTGFAITSKGFTIYNLMGWQTYSKEIADLGNCKITGKSCLAIKRVSEIDSKKLAAVIKKSLDDLELRYTTEK